MSAKVLRPKVTSFARIIVIFRKFIEGDRYVVTGLMSILSKRQRNKQKDSIIILFDVRRKLHPTTHVKRFKQYNLMEISNWKSGFILMNKWKENYENNGSLNLWPFKWIKSSICQNYSPCSRGQPVMKDILTFHIFFINFLLSPIFVAFDKLIPWGKQSKFITFCVKTKNNRREVRKNII